VHQEERQAQPSEWSHRCPARPGAETTFWGGISAPKNISAEIIDKLNKEINAGLADPKLMARLADLGGVALAGPPA